MRLGTGLPDVVDRVTGKRIQKEGRSYFPMNKFIYGEHTLAWMNSFSSALKVFLGVTQPFATKFFTVAMYERP